MVSIVGCSSLRLTSPREREGEREREASGQAKLAAESAHTWATSSRRSSATLWSRMLRRVSLSCSWTLRAFVICEYGEDAEKTRESNGGTAAARKGGARESDVQRGRRREPGCTLSLSLSAGGARESDVQRWRVMHREGEGESPGGHARILRCCAAALPARGSPAPRAPQSHRRARSQRSAPTGVVWSDQISSPTARGDSTPPPQSPASAHHCSPRPPRRSAAAAPRARTPPCARAPP